MLNTCSRFAGTHGSVLNRHTRRGFEPTHGEEGGGGGLSSLSSLLTFSLSSSFSLPSFPSFVLFLFLFSFSLLFSSLLFSLSNNDNDHSSSRFSLCTHGSDLPECQSACTLAHSLLAEHVRIMQETIAHGITVQASWNLE